MPPFSEMTQHGSNANFDCSPRSRHALVRRLLTRRVRIVLIVVLSAAIVAEVYQRLGGRRFKEGVKFHLMTYESRLDEMSDRLSTDGCHIGARKPEVTNENDNVEVTQESNNTHTHTHIPTHTHTHTHTQTHTHTHIHTYNTCK